MKTIFTKKFLTLTLIQLYFFIIDISAQDVDIEYGDPEPDKRPFFMQPLGIIIIIGILIFYLSNRNSDKK